MDDVDDPCSESIRRDRILSLCSSLGFSLVESPSSTLTPTPSHRLTWTIPTKPTKPTKSTKPIPETDGGVVVVSIAAPFLPHQLSVTRDGVWHRDDIELRSVYERLIRGIGVIESTTIERDTGKQQQQQEEEEEEEEEDDDDKEKKGWCHGEEDVDERYWWQRYRLFDRYDEGIRLDAESWYSVTPECIAQHTASLVQRGLGRCCRRPRRPEEEEEEEEERRGRGRGNGEKERRESGGMCSVLDAFAGAGGNSIQFARYACHVVALELDPVRAALCRHNARVYHVEHEIDVICVDALKWMQTNSFRHDHERTNPLIDVVYLSPPWGGPEYVNQDVFRIAQMGSLDGFEIFRSALDIAPNVIYYLPRNTSEADILRLCDMYEERFGAMESSRAECVIENNFINGRIRSITLYIGPHFRGLYFGAITPSAQQESSTKAVERRVSNPQPTEDAVLENGAKMPRKRQHDAAFGTPTSEEKSSVFVPPSKVETRQVVPIAQTGSKHRQRRRSRHRNRPSSSLS